MLINRLEINLLFGFILFAERATQQKSWTSKSQNSKGELVNTAQTEKIRERILSFVASYLRATLGFQALEAFKDSFTSVWTLSVLYTVLLNPRHEEGHKEASWKQVKAVTSSTGALLDVEQKAVRYAGCLYMETAPWSSCSYCRACYSPQT